MGTMSPEKLILKNRAVLLDRDGVINETIVKNGKPYPPQTLEELKILPHVLEALNGLKAAGFFLIIITNQPDVGRKNQKMSIVNQMHQYLLNQLPLDDIFVCIDETSPNYKPLPGMIFSAAKKHKLNLSESFMIGDRWKDINAGHTAGCKTIFIDCNYAEGLKQLPDFQCLNLFEASKFVLNTHFSKKAYHETFLAT